jgi:uncharacterized protein
MKRVVIVHGWDGTPYIGWFQWLKTELEAKGFEVEVPQLPDPEHPRIYNWIPKLEEVVGVAGDQTYFVGHSMGCEAIARYLETLPEGVVVGGAVFVAGFFRTLTGIDEDGQKTMTHWLSTMPDLAKVRSHLPKSVAIFSDNDPYVPLENQDDFKNALGSEIVIEHNKGHYNEAAGFKSLPIALQKVIELAS